MSSKTCPAGGEHVAQRYATRLFGIFVACMKCGTRDGYCQLTLTGNHVPMAHPFAAGETICAHCGVNLRTNGKS